MPEKFDRCVDNVKAKGGTDSPYAVCNTSIRNETKENVNQNRLDPYPSPDIKKGKVEPQINKTTKGIGGENPKQNEKRKKQEAILYKQIFDTKLGCSIGQQRKRR